MNFFPTQKTAKHQSPLSLASIFYKQIFKLIIYSLLMVVPYDTHNVLAKETNGFKIPMGLKDPIGRTFPIVKAFFILY